MNEASGYFRVLDKMVYFGNKKKYQEYLDMIKETTGHTLQEFEDGINLKYDNTSIWFRNSKGLTTFYA
jgi:hypothetical protein